MSRASTTTIRLDWKTILIVSTAVGLVDATRLVAVSRLGSPGVTISEALVRALPIWWIWGSFVPVIHWVTMRFPPVSPRWPRNLAAHAGAAAALSLTHSFVYVPLALYLVWPGLLPEIGSVWKKNFAGNLFGDFITYGLIAGVLHAIATTAAAAQREELTRELELRAARLESTLAESRLENLMRQTQPHFLFNALNTVATLVRAGRSSDALVVITRLSDLLRAAARMNDDPEATVEEELTLARAYGEIEQIRFGERLDIVWQIDDSAMEWRVPRFLVQPLLENAIRHGVAKRAAPSTVRVSAHAQNGDLRIDVRNPGDLDGDADTAGGTGLRNLRRRLDQLYGSGASLSLMQDEGEVVARVELSGGGQAA